MLAGLIQINKTRLIIYGAITPVLFAVVFGSSYWLLSSVISSEYEMDDVVKDMQISEKVPARVLNYKQLSDVNYFGRLASINLAGFLI